MFAHLIGNPIAKEFLSRMIQRQAIANSLLFAGPTGIGKSLFAQAFAHELLAAGDATGMQRHKLTSGNHPDLHIYRPEGKIAMHTISAMRQLSEEVWLPPHESQRKVFIVHDADRMLTYSANALLKTFEEPAPDTVIILLSSAPELLLPTILSRCQTLYFHRVANSDIVALLQSKYSLAPDRAEQIAHRARGSIAHAIELHEQGEDPMHEKMVGLLAAGTFRNYTALVQVAKELAGKLEAAAKEGETALREELTKGFTEKLSAVQRDAVDKEVDGLAAIQLVDAADALFEVLLTWFRDLHLLAAQGPESLLFHRERADALRKALTSGPLLPLEEVLAAVKQAKASLGRSTSLQLCLENLFLKLNLL
jgi:DNA polymerase-3 subunit delta'